MTASATSVVTMRARWDTEPVTAGEFLRLVRERGPVYTAEALADLEELKGADRPPRDKWARG